MEPEQKRANHDASAAGENQLGDPSSSLHSMITC
jgi:hypothetical protein